MSPKSASWSTAALGRDQGERDRPGDDVELLDLTDKFCVAGTCHALIGGVVVYFDSSHITSTYSRALAPYIEYALLDLDRG